jgi:membrane-bound lytic murein transglycosylase B
MTKPFFSVFTPFRPALRYAMPALVGALSLGAIPAGAQPASHPGLEPFLERAVADYGLDADRVAELLARAEFQQRVADLIARPAEAKPWYDYRPIFITDQRLQEGLTFWRANEALIAEVAERYGVDPQVIVAIIGVETYYGRITGDFRVLDALTTLSFYYPKDRTRDRTEFFSKELLEYVKLGDEEQLPLPEVTGSYAGAMGMGQFIPSSYREYAVDFDGDGRRDLWRSTADAVGSVANYLHRHGWQPGQPVVNRALASTAAAFGEISTRDFRPTQTVAEWQAKGFTSSPELDPDLPAAVMKLTEKERFTYWLTFKNFYVITRYNRSPRYAMAVYELSQEIKRGMEAL